jgi:hypothetical protein
VKFKGYLSGINDNREEEKGKYGLDRSKFIPRNEATQLAEVMATKMGDLKNYASYLGIVNKIGVAKGMQLLAVVQSDIAKKAETKTPVRNKGGYFVWIYKKGRY